MPKLDAATRAGVEQNISEPNIDLVALNLAPEALVRRVASDVMKTAAKVPRDGMGKISAGKDLITRFCHTVAEAGLQCGDETSQGNCSEFCAWVQTNCFDGITTDEHGPELRGSARMLNKAVEDLCSGAVPIPM